MILSNFTPTKITGKSALDYTYFADVSVTTTTGALWWKKTNVSRQTISREFLGYWFFVDTGEYTPGSQAENLERSFKAKANLPLE
jgi:hypothetical protein